MNSFHGIGRLTKDPESSNIGVEGKTPVSKFTIAIDRPRRNGEDQGADFIRVTVFGRQAETVDKYVSKGRQVGVSGRISTGTYKNNNGETVYTTEVIADTVEFLGSPSGNKSGNEKSETANSGAQTANEVIDDVADDVPF